MDKSHTLMPDTTLVVPCFNEAERLQPEAFITWLEPRSWARLMLVDDGSTDQTPAMLDELARSDRIEVLHLANNCGKAEAVRQGMHHAFSDTPALVGFWDADHATPLQEVDRFARRLQAEPELRLVMGSRVRVLGTPVDRHPTRHYIGRIAATGASALLGLPVYDTQCGAKLFRNDAMVRGLFAAPFHTRWAFDVEILARLIRAHPDLSRAELESIVVEEPVRTWRDVEGSRLGPTDFLRAPLDLLRIWWHERPGRYGS